MNRFLKHFVRCLWMTPIVAALLSLAVGACAQDEQPGSTVTYQISESGCGVTGGTFDHVYPLVNCFIGISQNGHALGSSWIYTSWGGNAQSQYGWASWQNLGDLSPNYQNNPLVSASWSVDTSTFNFNSLPGYPPPGPIVCNNNCSVLTANYLGITPDDGGMYTATITALFYFYRGCSSGRGGGCREIAMVLPSQPGDGTGLVVKYQ